MLESDKETQLLRKQDGGRSGTKNNAPQYERGGNVLRAVPLYARIPVARAATFAANAASAASRGSLTAVGHFCPTQFPAV